MTLLVTDILAGPARIYTAPVGTTLPIDTLAEDAAWPAGWVEIGYTKEPLTIAAETEVFDIEVEQSRAPVATRIIGQTLTIETVMAEMKLQQMAWAQGVGEYTLTTPPGAATEGLEVLTIGGEFAPTERAWGFEGKTFSLNGAAAYPIRVFVYRGVGQGNLELEFSKADYTGVTLNIKGLADTTKAVGAQLMRVARVIAPTGP